MKKKWWKVCAKRCVCVKKKCPYLPSYPFRIREMEREMTHWEIQHILLSSSSDERERRWWWWWMSFLCAKRKKQWVCFPHWIYLSSYFLWRFIMLAMSNIHLICCWEGHAEPVQQWKRVISSPPSLPLHALLRRCAPAFSCKALGSGAGSWACHCPYTWEREEFSLPPPPPLPLWKFDVKCMPGESRSEKVCFTGGEPVW